MLFTKAREWFKCPPSFLKFSFLLPLYLEVLSQAFHSSVCYGVVTQVQFPHSPTGRQCLHQHTHILNVVTLHSLECYNCQKLNLVYFVGYMYMCVFLPQSHSLAQCAVHSARLLTASLRRVRLSSFLLPRKSTRSELPVGMTLHYVAEISYVIATNTFQR